MGQIIQTNQVINHLYIHIPFCLKKCFYCSFYSVEYSQKLKNTYLESLKKEMNYYFKEYRIDAQTVYFGGGTPSLLTDHEIKEILDIIPHQDNTEITLECNPGTISEQYLQQIKRAGINRISMGIQSFNDKTLSYLGRIHDSETAKEAIELIEKEQFKSFSIDLIYGIPNQTTTDFLEDIDYCIQKAIPHISFYCLSLDEDVKLYSDKDILPDDEKINEMYHEARQKLIDKNYIHYEISNFSLPDNHSRHNSSYWNGKYYIGIGASASGYLPGFRYTNPSSLDDYQSMIESGIINPKREILTSDDLEKEYIITRLRTAQGIDLNDYQITFNTDFLIKYKNTIEKLNNYSLIEYNQSNFYIKSSAYLISNEILVEFI